MVCRITQDSEVAEWYSHVISSTARLTYQVTEHFRPASTTETQDTQSTRAEFH